MMKPGMIGSQESLLKQEYKNNKQQEEAISEKRKGISDR
jgi:hypothetical protein